MEQAARIAISTAIDFLRRNDRPELVRFVLYDAGAYGVFAAALQELTHEEGERNVSLTATRWSDRRGSRCRPSAAAAP